MQALLFGVMQAGQFLANGNWVAPDMAAWIPVIFGGCLASVVSSWIRT